MHRGHQLFLFHTIPASPSHGLVDSELALMAAQTLGSRRGALSSANRITTMQPSRPVDEAAIIGAFGPCGHPCKCGICRVGLEADRARGTEETTKAVLM